MARGAQNPQFPKHNSDTSFKPVYQSPPVGLPGIPQAPGTSVADAIHAFRHRTRATIGQVAPQFAKPQENGLPKPVKGKKRGR